MRRRTPRRANWQRAELAAAIDAAEERTGHQILVSVGSLRRRASRTADRIAARWSQASVVICIDPVAQLFELRWRDPSFELDAAHLDMLSTYMRCGDVSSAIALLADALPCQPGTAELPDVVGH